MYVVHDVMENISCTSNKQKELIRILRKTEKLSLC